MDGIGKLWNQLPPNSDYHRVQIFQLLHCRQVCKWTDHIASTVVCNLKTLNTSYLNIRCLKPIEMYSHKYIIFVQPQIQSVIWFDNVVKQKQVELETGPTGSHAPQTNLYSVLKLSKHVRDVVTKFST